MAREPEPVADPREPVDGSPRRPRSAIVALACCAMTSALALSPAIGQAGPSARAVRTGQDLRVDGERIARRIVELAQTAPDPAGGVRRIAFTPADVRGRAYVTGLMREAGLETTIDAAGNIIGRRRGTEPGLPPILFGSHIDSVPGAGRYDGVVGVMAAIEVAQVLGEAGIVTRHPLEVVVFSEEEGAMSGSRALVGDLGQAALDETTPAGMTRREGILAIGGDPDRLPEVARDEGEVAAFLELHIQQGGSLDAAGIDIGVVEGIVGIEWWDVTVEGTANHAGTTPMDRRQDALVAAARWILAVNEVATSAPGDHVATVGRIRAEPGAPNVIPGRVEASLEIRDLSRDTIFSLFDAIEARARRIGEETGTSFTFDLLDASALPVRLDEEVREIIAAAAERLGLSWISMPSGAGHDAQNVARIAPAGMIFVPSEGGVSHSPRERTSTEEIARGADVLLHTVLALDRRTLASR